MRKYFSAADDETIRAYYSAREGKGLEIDVLAKQMGRSRWSVAMRASRLGLCNSSRPKSDAHKAACKKAQREIAQRPEVLEKRARDKRAWHSKNPHPMQGRKHSKATRQKMREGWRRRKLARVTA